MRQRSASKEGEVLDLRGLARIGAGAAATTLGQLLGREVSARAPRTRGLARGAGLEGWTTGVLCEVHGDLEGLVAIALAEEAVETIAREFLRGAGAGPPADRVRSALGELGNIVASHTISAIANALGARLLPSVPTLVLEGEQPSLADRVERRRGESRGLCFVSDLEFGHRVRALLVWVPSPGKPGVP